MQEFRDLIPLLTHDNLTFCPGQRVVVLRASMLEFLLLQSTPIDPLSWELIDFLCREMKPVHGALCLGLGRRHPNCTDFEVDGVQFFGRNLVLSLARSDSEMPEYVVDEEIFLKRIHADWELGAVGLMLFDDDLEHPEEVLVTRIRVADWKSDPTNAFEVTLLGSSRTSMLLGPHEMDFLRGPLQEPLSRDRQDNDADDADDQGRVVAISGKTVPSEAEDRKDAVADREEEPITVLGAGTGLV